MASAARSGSLTAGERFSTDRALLNQAMRQIGQDGARLPGNRLGQPATAEAGNFSEMTSEATSVRRGVLFDIDGTLVDTSYLHTVAWWQAFRQAGLDASMARIHRAIGMGGDHLVHEVTEGAADDRTTELSDSHDALYSAYWPALRLLPGARELVRHCHEAGLVTVLASSAGSAEFEVLTKVLDLGDVVDEATGSADAEGSKPDPDIVLVALDKAGLQPQNAVFVGDAIWDVQASAKAGLRCIGLESGGTSAAELIEAGAVQTYRDAAELLERFSGSPLDFS
jgi:HAD superfamily hydrolase (TIGR01509 family)